MSGCIKQFLKLLIRFIGIDFLNKEILEIQEKLGYEGYFADVMELDKLKLEGAFDIIVCGELVNSIENPGLMFDGLKRFMHSESLIAISTPNPYSISRIFKVLMGKTDDKWVYSIAIMWQSYGTLINLAKRCGFTISFKGYYNGYEYKGSLKDIIKSMLPKRLQDGLFFTLKIK